MPEPITIAAAIASEASPIIRGALGTLASTISSNIGRLTRSAADRAIVALQLGFSDYLKTSYERCRYFKTILDPHQPQSVLSHYVNNTLSCGKLKISDDSLVDEIFSYRHLVITGLAGSGKSMFMKYLTLRHFEQPRGAVPLFVELRHLNQLTDRNLLAFIRTSCTSRMHNVTEDQFDLSLRSGALILILDGFDELNHDSRDQMQSQILTLIKDFPQTSVIVSSRPDHRFGSWQNFHVFKVDELTEAQSIKLIESLEYDSSVKRRFLKEVKSRLYKSHKSFLSYPLLASIMLLTFEEFAEIPQKMHAFYGQAFDTLFQKHDAQKDQYQRQIKTGLSRDDFKACFAAFCALSYLDEKYSFSRDQLISASEKAVSYTKQTRKDMPSTLTASNLVDDLFEAVCMLQPDGIESAFVHRSFQEYFAAVFASNLHGNSIKRFMDKCCVRFGDSVVAMSMDMSRESIEKEWIIPTIVEVERTFWGIDAPKSIAEKYAKVIDGVELAESPHGLLGTVQFVNMKLYGQLVSLGAAYPDKIERTAITKPFDSLTWPEFISRISNEKFRHEPNFAKMTKFRARTLPTDRDQTYLKHTKRINFSEADDWWMSEIGISANFGKIKRALSAIKRDIRSRDAKRTNILDDFL